MSLASIVNRAATSRQPSRGALHGLIIVRELRDATWLALISAAEGSVAPRGGSIRAGAIRVMRAQVAGSTTGRQSSASEPGGCIRRGGLSHPSNHEAEEHGSNLRARGPGAFANS